jgi:hypothetical protein
MFKYILGAAALTIAAPVFAQAAPATDPHAGHAGHAQTAPQQSPSAPAGHQMGQGQTMDHGQMMDHGKMMDCCKKCDEDSKGDSKMPCCDQAKESAPEAPAAHQH